MTTPIPQTTRCRHRDGTEVFIEEEDTDATTRAPLQQT
jgi:hypothetical protein